MSVSITDFGKLTTGQPVQLVTLKNDKIEVQLLTYAAIIHRIIVPDRQGSPTDVVLGYPTARDYELNTDSMGAAVGRFANRIARKIVESRAKAPIETTLQLVELIKAAIPAAARRTGGHPARKAFQALRIEVNHELDVLDRGLRAAVRWANTGGRICVISYHSLEDRIVKHVFSEMSRGCICPPDLPVCACGRVPILDVRTRKPLVASDEEVAANPRSRSALMRVAVKLDVTGAEPSR